MHTQVIQAICIGCHTASGLAKNANLVFVKGLAQSDSDKNVAALNSFVAATSPFKVLNKVKGMDAHGGGAQLSSVQAEYKLLLNYLELHTGKNLHSGPALASTLYESPATSYRRASLLLTGKIPSAATLTQMANADNTTLRNAYLKLMEKPGFKEFLTRGANDKLLVRGEMVTRKLSLALRDFYQVNDQKVVLERDASGKVARWDYLYAHRVDDEIAEAPLELIAHVVQNNKPYSEILTAPYTMVGRELASVYKTGVIPAAGTFVPAVNKGQAVKWAGAWDGAFPSWDWNKAVTVEAMPHAGVLSDLAFLAQYPTSPTNRNRARARWTYMHFLGVDIENSTARTLEAAALTDQNNPTLKNPACASCHERLDPVAGAFQKYSERGFYGTGPQGLNSLDFAYRQSPKYNDGDTWYSDMRKPGFEQEVFDPDKDSLQQLAAAIVADPRFAEGAVKFWWPAIFGENMFDDTSEADSFNYDNKMVTLKKFAGNFTTNQLNLKLLLADMLMSDWFRGRAVNANTAVGARAISSGGKRLLTPEELFNKSASLFGIKDYVLSKQLALSFGGIDSVETSVRQRHISHMMLRVAERHALANSCAIVAAEFNLPKTERALFTLVERETAPDSELVAQQIVLLLERTQGLNLKTDSLEVKQYLALFNELRSQKSARGEKFLDEKHTNCRYDAKGKPRAQWAADNNHTLGAWRGLVTALMANYYYIYE